MAAEKRFHLEKKNWIDVSNTNDDVNLQRIQTTYWFIETNPKTSEEALTMQSRCQAIP
jgi:predicted neuraminidase